jgi:flagellar assembly protein FliH
MSSRARRVTNLAVVRPYDWSGRAPVYGSMPAAPPAAPPAGPAVDAAQIERDAFMKGYAQGERAGAEAAAARGEAVLRRLAATIEELRALKTDILHKTEQQVVELAFAIARRIVQREVSLDRGLVAAMARVALDRLGDAANATIRLHPDDYAAVMSGRQEGALENGVATVVADPMVRRGGCLVQSDLGLIDASADAQIGEIASALLGDAGAERATETADVFAPR